MHPIAEGKVERLGWILDPAKRLAECSRWSSKTITKKKQALTSLQVFRGATAISMNPSLILPVTVTLMFLTIAQTLFVVFLILHIASSKMLSTVAFEPFGSGTLQGGMTTAHIHYIQKNIAVKILDAHDRNPDSEGGDVASNAFG